MMMTAVLVRTWFPYYYVTMTNLFLLLLGSNVVNMVNSFYFTNDFYVCTHTPSTTTHHHRPPCWHEQHYEYPSIKLLLFASRHSQSIDSYDGIDEEEEEELNSTAAASMPLMEDSNSMIDYWNRRRHVLASVTRTVVSIGSTSFLCPRISHSVITSSADNVDRTVNTRTDTAVLNCLQDLPTYDPTSTVRLYLCRHGETDNNRKNIIQGARINPPINAMGIEQAKLLGQALCRTIQQTSSVFNDTTIILHSPLLRAQQTGSIVAEQMSRHLSDPPTTTRKRRRRRPLVQLRQLDTLGEVDFGSIAEGAPVQQYRNELVSLYTSWALGNYNARMPLVTTDTATADGGDKGESGLEILGRIGAALRTMIDMAAYETNSSSLVAITHSAYLRLLLGAVQDFALFSPTIPQSNCGINVIDFPYPSNNKSVATTFLLTNSFGQDSNNTVQIPKGDVVRVNEKRHLTLLTRNKQLLTYSE